MAGLCICQILEDVAAIGPDPVERDDACCKKRQHRSPTGLVVEAHARLFTVDAGDFFAFGIHKDWLPDPIDASLQGEVIAHFLKLCIKQCPHASVVMLHRDGDTRDPGIDLQPKKNILHTRVVIHPFLPRPEERIMLPHIHPKSRPEIDPQLLRFFF